MPDIPAAAEAFVAAIQSGDAQRLERHFADDPDATHWVHEPLFAFDAPAIVFAAARANRPLVDVLLRHGADINARSSWWAGGFGVLHSAKGEFAAYLMSRGADLDLHAAARLDFPDLLGEMLSDEPHRVDEKGPDGQRPLHMAANAEIADLLLEADADLEARCVDHGGTPAQYAAIYNTELCRYLLSQGAKPDLFMAVLLDDREILAEMLAAEPELARAKVDEEPFVAPDSEGGHIYRYLIGSGATPLHIAAARGFVPCARLLLEAGALTNESGAYDDGTPLHFAAWNNHPDVIKLLLEHNGDLERRSGPAHHNTPLGWAVVAGAVEAVTALRDAGAVVHDYIRKDAARGVEGAFTDYCDAKAEAYEAIVALLTKT